MAAALKIVMAENLSALTMPRLAEELECGIGTLYRHFSSKDALIAELQLGALDVIGASFRESQANLDRLMGERGIDDPVQVALARVVGAARYWTLADSVLPQEIDLLRRMFTDVNLRMDDDEGSRLVPPSFGLLELAWSLLQAAADEGAIEEGPAILRAIVLLSGTTGVLMTSALDRWDSELFHAHALASMMTRDLFRGWGADRGRLDAIEPLLDELETRGLLVPAAPMEAPGL